MKKPKKEKNGRQEVTFDTTLHVAKLARLRLSLDEARNYQKDLNAILSAFSDLKKVKTKETPTFHPLDVKDTVRKDEIEKCLSNEVALANTRHKEKGFFKGPRAV